jgi:hypothetical protein
MPDSKVIVLEAETPPLERLAKRFRNQVESVRPINQADLIVAFRAGWAEAFSGPLDLTDAEILSRLKL